jgi:hypothetical protein
MAIRNSAGVVRVLSVTLVALTAGCGFKETVEPPPGWRASPQLFGTQKLSNPANADEYILIAHPREPLPADYPATQRRTTIRICGDHPATLMESRGEINGKDVQMDGVDTTWDGARVMAMYARPYGRPANPAAERTNRSICAAR